MSLIDPDILIEKARQFARTDDFLGEHWQPALRTLVAAIDAEAGLHSSRQERLAIELLSLLVTRSRIAAQLRARPEIAEIPVPRRLSSPACRAQARRCCITCSRACPETVHTGYGNCGLPHFLRVRRSTMLAASFLRQPMC